jgi:hypothetical protein
LTLAGETCGSAARGVVDSKHGLESRRRIPHVQLRRYRRFREEALERWLEDLELGAGKGQRSARLLGDHVALVSSQRN